MYIHYLKVIFVLLLICHLLQGHFSREPRMVEGKLFLLLYRVQAVLTESLEYLKNHCKCPQALFMPNTLEMLGSDFLFIFCSDYYSLT